MPLPDITSLAHCLANPKPKPKALIDGLLHVTTKDMLGGGSKSNKTWVQIDRAISISSGTPWLGFKTQKSRVLFMNMEIIEPFFMERIQMVLDGKKLRMEDCDLDLWHLRGHTEGFTEFLPRIADVINATRSHPYELIIADPLYKIYGKINENDAGEVIDMLNHFETFVQKTNCALSFSAHFTKGFQDQKSAIDRVSGSGAFARDADSIMTLTRHKEPHCFTIDFILRNCPEIDPFVVEWTRPLMHRREDLDPKHLDKPQNGTGKSNGTSACDAEDILEHLPEAGLRNGAWQALCVEKLHISERTFNNKLKICIEDDLVVKDGKVYKRVYAPTNGTHD